ncbi:hypothetical protein GWK47_015736 [Chionoecetes opilio]|uniref:Uncharacterized protein n=1 Tax=Chionoecetes opilio TaxID=41210 RepID=A0A8J4XX17_CHIOP|nr:hypothetical protein GWK47_015736 [Chionoecetes opilio]
MMVDAEKDDRHAKLTEPVFEDKEQCPLNNLRERSRSPSSLANKEQNMDKICREKSPTTLGKSFLRSAREDSPVQSERRTRDSQTPTKDDLTTMTSPLEKVDGNTATTPEPRWKLDLPMKPIEHPIEILRKPPTPPTLFPPLPWQTNPENFSDNDPLRPKTPDNVNYLGVKGPRTPEGPAPTSPSNSSTSSHPSPLRSPFAIGGGSEETKGEDRRAGENAIEGSWRPRARGPCTPPSPHSQEATPEDQHQQHQQQEGGEEAGSSPSHHYPHSNSESTQKRNAPVKKKLSILEYRKRKSVGGEAGPLDSSPPPCPPSHRNEFSLRGGPHSPSSSSPPGLMGGSGEDEGESNRSSAAGTASSSDLNKHSLINKNMSSNSNNSSSNTTTTSTTTTNSSSNSSNTPAVSEASTSLTATTTSTSTTTGSHSLHTITGGSAQDVKWNAAPTLLERQRENLTARLRREFGLCVADDDEDKSGLRLNCSGMLSRPTPPLLSPTTPLATTSPLSRKPPVLTVGPACMSYLTEGDERTHRRHKSLLPPPPPPPPTAQPKNSIFHGREVIEPKVLCGMKCARDIFAPDRSSGFSWDSHRSNRSSFSALPSAPSHGQSLQVLAYRVPSHLDMQTLPGLGVRAVQGILGRTALLQAPGARDGGSVEPLGPFSPLPLTQ